MNKSYKLWKYMFEKSYEKLTGMTWEDGGGDDEEMKKYFDWNYTPADAVQDQIRKYDLEVIS